MSWAEVPFTEIEGTQLGGVITIVCGLLAGAVGLRLLHSGRPTEVDKALLDGAGLVAVLVAVFRYLDLQRQGPLVSVGTGLFVVGIAGAALYWRARLIGADPDDKNGANG